MLREGKMGRGGVERERELRLGEGEMCETRGGERRREAGRGKTEKGQGGAKKAREYISYGIYDPQKSHKGWGGAGRRGWWWWRRWEDPLLTD